MADEFQIELSAIVDTSKIQEQLNGVKDLSIKISDVKIDTSQLQTQLNGAKNLKLKISDIEIDRGALSGLQSSLSGLGKMVGKGTANIGKEIGKGIATSIESEITKGLKSGNLDINSIMKDIKGRYGVSDKDSLADIRKEIDSMMTSIIKKSTDKDYVPPKNAMDFVKEIRSLVKEGATYKDDKGKAFSELYDYFKGKKIFISDEEKSRMGSALYDDFTKAMTSSHIVRKPDKGGVKLDEIWRELVEKTHGMFQEDEKDQYEALARAYTHAREEQHAKTMHLWDREMPPDIRAGLEGDIDSYVQQLAQQIVQNVRSSIANMPKEAVAGAMEESLPAADAGKAAYEAGQQAGEQYQKGISDAVKDGESLVRDRQDLLWKQPFEEGQDYSDVAKQAKAYYEGIMPKGTKVSVSDLFTFGDADGEAKAFTVTLQKMNGEVEKLQYRAKAIPKEEGGGTIFSAMVGTTSDSGIAKASERVEKLKRDMASFVADKPQVKIDTTSFDAAVKDFENGAKTLTQVQAAFDNVKNSVKETGGGLLDKDHSLNQFQQALNNIRDFPSEFAKIKTDFGNLLDQSNFGDTLGNTQWIDELERKFGELQKMVAGGQIPAGDKQFVAMYQEVAEAMAKAKADIAAQQKTEKADSTSFAKQQVDAYKQLESQMRQIYDLKNKLLTTQSGSAFDELTKQLTEAQEQAAVLMRTIFEGTGDTGKTFLDEGLQANLEKTVATLENNYQLNLAKQIDVISDSLTKADDKISSFQQKLGKMAEGTEPFDKAKTSLDNLRSAYEEVSKASDEYKQNNSPENFQALTAAHEQLNDQLHQTQQVYKDVAVAANQAVDPTQLANAQKQFENYFTRNTKAARVYADQVKELREQLNGVSTQGDFKNYKTAFAEFDTMATKEGNKGTGLLDFMKGGASNVMKMFGIYGAGMTARRVGQQMVNNVREINKAETELRKVTGASQKDIAAYFDQAAASAKKYGTEIQNVVNVTADWSRLN